MICRSGAEHLHEINSKQEKHFINILLVLSRLSESSQVQSTMGTVRLDKVAAAGEGAPFMMFQLYVIKEREYTQRLIQGQAHM